MATKKRVKTRTVNQSPLSHEVRVSITDAIICFPWGPTKSSFVRDAVFHNAVQTAASILIHGRVKDAHIALFDRTPVMRVTFSYQGKKIVINKTNPFCQLLARSRSVEGVSMPDKFYEEILKVLPQDILATQMAAIENACAQAMLDPKKLGPIRERLNKRRVADRERLMARIRGAFQENDGLLTEDDVLQMWRETVVVGPIHDS